MPWGWDIRGPVSINNGGNVGTAKEASEAHAWPDYEAQYLAKRLQRAAGKYNPALTMSRRERREAAAHTYYDKITENYKEEADECLRAEFNDWLQGKHEVNSADSDNTYANVGNKPKRYHMHRDSGVVTTERNDWKHTDWGDKQLTHLPGVRDYLRDIADRKQRADVQMNLLAEYGPQNLEEAWLYFKHWVKARPIGPDMCMHESNKTLGIRSDFGMQPPGGRVTTVEKQPTNYATSEGSYEDVPELPAEDFT